VRLRTEVKVGLIVAAGFVALLFVYWFLRGMQVRSATYTMYGVFPNALRLDRGSIVRMAGVQIGNVSRTSLQGIRARVDMRIDKEIVIPRDSVARITTGGLVGENYVEIAPGRSGSRLRDGARINTAVAVQPEQLMEQASDILNQLSAATRSINEVLGDKEIVAAIKSSVLELRTATRYASRLAENSNRLVDSTSPRVSAILSQLDQATRDAARSSAQVGDMLEQDVRPNVRALLAQSGDVARNLNTAVLQAQRLMGAIGERTASVDEIVAKINQALDKVNAAADQGEQMMANLNEASGGLRNLATDQALQADIKRTVRNAAEASAEAKQLLCDLNRRLGRGAKAEPVDKGEAPESGTSVNALWNTNAGDYRFDAYYTYLQNGGSLYRAGGYNIGENTRAILQAGRLFGSGNAFRYGLYASRLGVGYDRKIGGGGVFSADLFRPNDPEMEIRAVLGIRGPFGVYAGLADVFDNDKRDLLVGVRYQK
jgi:phospholipid/cholesterol/gamma-HCH transport system substrate-binding protein